MTTLANVAPTASFTKTVNYLTVNLASTSTDDASVVIYNWDLGDGSATQSDVSPVIYTYADAGTYTITLSAIDF